WAVIGALLSGLLYHKESHHPDPRHGVFLSSAAPRPALQAPGMLSPRARKPPATRAGPRPRPRPADCPPSKSLPTFGSPLFSVLETGSRSCSRNTLSIASCDCGAKPYLNGIGATPALDAVRDGVSDGTTYAGRKRCVGLFHP